MIIATITEYGTDEDTELASRVMRSVADNFLMRPSVEDRALRTISIMANNDLVLMRAENDSTSCDGAVVFLNRNMARFMISGNGAAYHFEDGKLAHRSERKEASVLGFGTQYEPHLEPEIQIKPGKNAFLTASPALGEALSDQAVEEALSRSETPEEWMEHLKALMGDRQFCAVAAFLPETKPSFIKNFVFRKREGEEGPPDR